ncbi:MAG: tRNA lysidine(34) synthetase TilS [Solobacterium sp.]|nr:tRNA lysidine(34) synthetase TilS [Solobacterium sp.]
MEKLNGIWLVGVSCGPDSMALLDMLLQSKTEVVVAFVNYHTRTQSEQEEAFIRKYCKEKKLICHILNEEFRHQGNFEAEARKWRYDFFVRLVKEYGYQGVLLGHHQDDLLETYFMQEEKNLIPEYYGLKEEMLYHGILVKRPLLSYTKQELLDYCINNQIPYFIDESNASRKYTRNRIREDVVSKLNAQERIYVLKEIEKKNAIRQERICRVKTYFEGMQMDLMHYRTLPYIEREEILRILLKEKKYSAKHIEQIDAILMKKKDFCIEVSKESALVQKEGKFFLYQGLKDYVDHYENREMMLGGENGKYRIEEGSLGVYALTLKDEDFPLVIRNAKEGDKIQMRFGTKLVHRFFIDRKIPLYQRRVWPVVENAKGDIIFVSELGCDVEHYSIKPDFNVIQCF